MFISTGHNICLCNLCTSISWGFMYSYVIYACFISIYTHDVNFTYDFYSVFYNALARESATFVVLRHSCTFLHCVYLHYWSYTSRRLMFFVVKTTWNKACSILFYSILFYLHPKWLLSHSPIVNASWPSFSKRPPWQGSRFDFNWKIPLAPFINGSSVEVW